MRAGAVPPREQAHAAEPRTTSGLVIVDKPAGWTSHDVVARIRRLSNTRRVGHAGTLDPMATGVLVVGVDKATRLLGHLALTDKEYTATIRLGQATDTDDAEGTVTAVAAATDVTDEQLRRAIGELTGNIWQVPPRVSAIKVAGRRSYRLARAGEAPDLAARAVTVSDFAVLALRRCAEVLDVDVRVGCSSGTYIRALARDLGAALGVGGHLTALRRTRVGPYLIGQARTLDQLSERFEVIPLARAAAAAFARRDLTPEEARLVAHGGRLPAAGTGGETAAGTGGKAAAGTGGAPVAAFGPDGSLVALLADADGGARSLAVFADEGE